MDFTENNILYIKKLCGEFVEEHYKDEEIYFDEFWKIYEPALQSWIGKPPKKWRLKLSRRRFPRVIGMADGSEAIELVTPKILEVVATSYTHIARIRETLSLQRVKEVLEMCAKKLPDSVKMQTVNFFSPLILNDLEVAEGATDKKVKSEKPIWEKPQQQEEKKEYKAYPHESLDGNEIKALFDQINSSQHEDLEFNYTMFTEQDVRENIEDTLRCRKKLTEEWHSEINNLYPKLAEEFLYILDFISDKFYFDGKELWTSTDEKVEYNYYKALAIILLSSKESQITFKELYVRVTSEDYVTGAKNTVQHWVTVLKHRLGVKKKDLNRLFKSWKSKEKNGYEVVKESEPTFLVLLEKEMTQKILKYSIL